MPILVPDKTRKFPLQQIELADYTINDLFAQFVNFKRVSAPDYTDESPSDAGMQLGWLFSVMTDLMIRTVNQTAKDSFLLTAVNREAVRALCAQFGYTLQEASAATVQVRFTLEGGHPEFTIPAGSQVSTAGSDTEDPVIFETVADQLIQVGASTVDIGSQQGETVSQEIIGSSDGSADQVMYLRRRPVVWQSELIEVNEGTGFESWTRVDDFLDSDSNDKHYLVDLDNYGYCYLYFGDGINGKVPAAVTNNVRATYRRGGGSAGNVGAGQIIELLSNLDYVESISNPSPASGGDDQESITRARKFAPASIRILDRIVTAQDIQSLLANFSSDDFGTIAQSRAAGIDNLTVDVRFVPAIGGVPTDGFKTEVGAFLDERRMINTEIAVNDPEFTQIDYDIEIWLHDGYNQDSVVEQVRQAIIKFGSPIYRSPDGIYPNEFGADVKISNLYAAIMAVEGLSSATITSPAADVTVPDTHIREINSIDIIAHQGGSQSSYLNLDISL